MARTFDRFVLSAFFAGSLAVAGIAYTNPPQQEQSDPQSQQSAKQTAKQKTRFSIFDHEQKQV